MIPWLWTAMYYKMERGHFLPFTSTHYPAYGSSFLPCPGDGGLDTHFYIRCISWGIRSHRKYPSQRNDGLQGSLYLLFLLIILQLFLGNEEKVYILDKAEMNSAQINGHPAWGAMW